MFKLDVEFGKNFLPACESAGCGRLCVGLLDKFQICLHCNGAVEEVVSPFLESFHKSHHFLVVRRPVLLVETSRVTIESKWPPQEIHSIHLQRRTLPVQGDDIQVHQCTSHVLTHDDRLPKRFGRKLCEGIPR
jgi:hypothetical protein